MNRPNVWQFLFVCGVIFALSGHGLLHAIEELQKADLPAAPPVKGEFLPFFKLLQKKKVVDKAVEGAPQNNVEEVEAPAAAGEVIPPVEEINADVPDVIEADDVIETPGFRQISTVQQADGVTEAEEVVVLMHGEQIWQMCGVAMACGVVQQGDLDGNADEWVNELQPMLSSELMFVNSLFDLDRDQHRALKRLGAKCLKETALKFVTLQRAGDQKAMESFPVPQDQVRLAFVEKIGELLGQEQSVQLETELKKRSAGRREDVVQILVAKLDVTLFLSEVQRTRLHDALLNNWQAGWENSLPTWQFEENCFPTIKDPTILGLFNEQQKEIWQGVRKTEVHNFGAFGRDNLMQQDDGPVDMDVDFVEAG